MNMQQYKPETFEGLTLDEFDQHCSQNDLQIALVGVSGVGKTSLIQRMQINKQSNFEGFDVDIDIQDRLKVSGKIEEAVMIAAYHPDFQKYRMCIESVLDSKDLDLMPIGLMNDDDPKHIMMRETLRFVVSDDQISSILPLTLFVAYHDDGQKIYCDFEDLFSVARVLPTSAKTTVNKVISMTGSFATLCDPPIQVVRKNSLIVHIKPTDEDDFERVLDQAKLKPIVLDGSKTLREIFNDRISLYDSIANLVIKSKDALMIDNFDQLVLFIKSRMLGV